MTNGKEHWREIWWNRTRVHCQYPITLMCIVHTTQLMTNAKTKGKTFQKWQSWKCWKYWRCCICWSCWQCWQCPVALLRQSEGSIWKWVKKCLKVIALQRIQDHHHSKNPLNRCHILNSSHKRAATSINADLWFVIGSLFAFHIAPLCDQQSFFRRNFLSQTSVLFWANYFPREVKLRWELLRYWWRRKWAWTVTSKVGTLADSLNSMTDESRHKISWQQFPTSSPCSSLSSTQFSFFYFNSEIDPKIGKLYLSLVGG